MNRIDSKVNNNFPPVSVCNSDLISGAFNLQTVGTQENVRSRIINSNLRGIKFPIGSCESDRRSNFMYSFVISEQLHPTKYNWRSRLIIYSELSNKNRVIRGLFLKWLYSSLTELEYKALLFESLNKPELLAALKARQTVPKLLLSIRVNALSILKGKRPIFSYRNFLSEKPLFPIVKEVDIFSPPRPYKKYSGWKRHQNDQGSINPFPKIDPEPIGESLNFEEEFNFFFELFSVGFLPLEAEGSLKMALMKAETEKFKLLVEQSLKGRTR